MQYVFISYVRDNEEAVSRLYHDLTSHGINVWLDRNKIKPGFRWKPVILKAIQNGAFFIACFSKEYNNRGKTYMNEELTVATEVLRQQHYTSDKAWFIPVKLNECEIPDRGIGGGETFKDFQYVELYEDWDLGIQYLLESISPETAEAEKHLRTGNEKANFADVRAAREETIRIKTTEASLRSQNTHAQREQPASKTMPDPVASPRDPGLAEAYYQQGLKKEQINQNETERRTRESSSFNSFEIALQQSKAQQRSESAIADYDEAIRLDPNEACYYSQRAGTYVQLKRHAAAFVDYDKAIQLSPEEADFYYQRISLNQELGQLEAVVADYDEL